MNKTAYLLVALLALSAVPVLAQGPFTDVPADHWAYDAVNTLQKDGIMIGYPDGTFQGKRTITRYEFAAAIVRAMAAIPAGSGGGISKADVEKMLAPYALKSDIAGPANLANLATKADVDALRKLIDEFRDEIAALGVDVDALKRDVAALGARVDAIEAEMKRVRFTGNATVFAIASASNGVSSMIDLDQRVTARPNDSILRNISMVKDADLIVAGRVNNCVTANATINYGDYLNYLGAVDDYVGGQRPVNRMPGPGVGGTLADTFFPYYLSIDAALGKGSVSVGRFPLQFTPYTLKKIDVDSYTSILKTDDGNYPVDGAKVAWNFGGVDLTLYAAKHDANLFLANGLTGQPSVAPGVFFHQVATGNAVGGLAFADQSAGARATVGIPFQGILGLTYYQAWDQSSYNASVAPPVGAGALTFDQARVYGADLAIPIPWVNTMAFAASYTRSDTISSNNSSGLNNVDYANSAWDGRLSGNVAALNIGAGYKSIGRNFAAAGFWDKIGRWANPTNIQGPYAEFAYPIMDNLKVSLNGEYLKVLDNNPGNGAWGTSNNDKLIKAEGAIRWGFTKSNSVDLAYQWVKFTPNNNYATATENYITLGLSHQMTPNAAVKLGYQLISYDNGNTPNTVPGGPYGTDYKGGLGVVQVGVSF